MVKRRKNDDLDKITKRINIMTPYAFLVLVSCMLFSLTQPVKWVAIGDSITYLNDHADETGNRITMGYMTMIRNRHPGIEFVNKGFNGWTSGDVATRIDALEIGEADVYSVFLGTNDWWQGRPAGTLSDYKRNRGAATINGAFRIIVDKIRSLNSKARIILVTPLQRGDFVYINDGKNNAYGSYREKNGQTLAQVARAIADIGAYEGFTVVDLYNDSGITQENMVVFKRLMDPTTGELRDYKYPVYVDVPFDPETDAYPYPPEAIDMTYDGLHPSDKGYAVIASMLEKAILKP